MPKPLDPEVEKRVLDAAEKLLRGGEKNLSIRTLAKAARTNTPSIYRRFRDRNDILRAILLRLEQRLHRSLSEADSLEAASDRYIDFALHHRKEYEMWFTRQSELLRSPHRGRPSAYKGPSFQWAEKKLAERLGGTPEKHARLVFIIWSLFHGVAALLVAKALPRELEEEARSTCRRTVTVLIENAARIKSH